MSASVDLAVDPAAAWNRTDRAAPERACIHTLFAERVRQTPEALAIVDGDLRLSFGELAARARVLAWSLFRRGIGPESRVGISLPRSVDSVVAVLAAWQVGAAYLALDPAYPAARLRYMMDDAAPGLVLTRSSLAAPWAESYPRLDVDNVNHTADPDPEPPPVRVDPSAPAYVIYTSGSTGAPKGVVGEHNGMVNRMRWMWRTLPFGQDAVVAHRSSLNFLDVVCEVWGSLIAGVPIVVIPPTLDGDPRGLLRVLDERRVTHLILVPSLLRAALDAIEAGAPRPARLRRIHSSGEPLDAALAVRCLRLLPGRQLVNLYGASELSADVTTIDFVDPGEVGEMVPIGAPIDNTRIYVLDESLAPCPVGDVGEIYAAGVGLARGYLDRPGLTAERFLPDLHGAPGERMYRTGDRGRWRADGLVECVGRTDQLVKIRGFRVELGEVEAALRSHAEVDACVVVRRSSRAGDARLVAYFVGAVSPVDLREHLSRLLPDYMRPAACVSLPALPLTPSGKVDRVALPDVKLDRSGLSLPYTSPRSPAEQRLVAIWREVLEVEHIGVHDPFLALGGHSLGAAEVANRVARTFELEVSAGKLLQAATIAEQAALLDVAGRARDLIRPVAADERVAADAAQARLWLLDRLDPGTPEYNVPLALRLRGPLDVDVLADALTWLAERHELLRARLPSDADGPVLEIGASSPVTLTPIELEASALDACLRELTRLPFDLAVGPLWRARLLRLDEDHHALLLVFHHVVVDGWSLMLVRDELKVAYEAFARGAAPELAPLQVGYRDYAAWRRRRLSEARLRPTLDWWRETLSGAESLALPMIGERPVRRSIRGERLPVAMDERLSARVDALARANGVTPYMVALAGFALVLARHTGQREVVIGSPVTQRPSAELEPLVGMFVNTLPLRFELPRRLGVRQLLERARSLVLGALSHADAPFDRIVEASGVERERARMPLVQVMLVLEGRPITAGRVGPLAVEPLPVDPGVAQFELTLNLERQVDGYRGYLEYCVDLLEREAAERIVGHLQQALRQLVGSGDTALDELELLTESEAAAIRAWSTGAALTPPPVTGGVHQLVLHQAARSPENPAIVCGEQRLSYRALRVASARLSAQLVALGVGAEDRVGLHLERSPDIVVAMLAVLMAGGAFVALDPSYPDARLQAICARAAPTLILSRAGAVFDGLGSPVLDPDTLRDSPYAPIVPAEVAPGQLAYLVFTSGSTGEPKGVALTHESATAFLSWVGRVFDRELLAGVIATTSFSFDVSIFEIFGPLAWGGTVYLMPDVFRIEGLDARARLLSTVPSAMRWLVESRGLPPSVRALNLAGESLSRALVDDIFETFPQVELVRDLYGPTEDTTYSTWTRRRAGAPARIGQPIDGTQAHVLTDSIARAPIGVAGELHLAGVGLARGYLGLPALTAARFVPDPYGPPGARMYRTGDRARWRAGGELEYLGRLDHQIKLRGVRIEPGEVERALSRHPSVRACVVGLHRTPGHDPRLVGWLVGQPVGVAELRAHAARSLPRQMIPSAFVWLDAVPMTANGKVDRAALPSPPAARAGEDRDKAPTTSTEGVVIALWREVLGEEGAVGVEQDFFELGGHSLRVARLASLLARRFDVEVPLPTLFELRTVAAQARWIESASQRGQTIRRRDVDEGPLSAAQARLWFLEQLNPGTPEYNVPLPLRVFGPLDPRALSVALTRLQQRHDTLRTRLRVVDELVQRVEAAATIELVSESLDAALLDERLSAEAARPFEFDGGPLWRVVLWRLAPEDHVLLLTAHHLIIDGGSLELLVGDLARCYADALAGRASPSSSSTVRYLDYALWEAEQLATTEFARDLEWWRGELSGAPTLALPTDHARSERRTSRGAVRPMRWRPGALDELDALARSRSVTPYMIALTAFAVVLARLTGQDEVVIGSPVANRARPELQSIVGLFVNTLALRVELSGAPSVDELLSRVREVTLAAYARQGVPFDRVVEALGVARDPTTTPVFQVMLVFEDAPFTGAELGDATMHLLPVHTDTVKFDLIVRFERTPEGLSGQIEYSTELFAAGTVDRIASYLQRTLDAMLEDPSRRALELDLLAGAERDRLLVDWNGATPTRPHAGHIHGRFARFAAVRPNAPALIFRGEATSYCALLTRARRLARYLAPRVGATEQRVAVYMHRGPAAVETIFALLELGAVFVPIEPNQPPLRVRRMLDLASVTIALTDGADVSLLPPGVEVVNLNAARADVDACAARPLARLTYPAQLAYVMFTSGTTGVPKGILMTHESVLTRVDRTERAHGIGPGDRVLQNGNLSFDLFIWELFIPLLSGATVVMSDPDRLGDFGHLAALLEREQITIARFIPALLRLLFENAELGPCRQLRKVITGGDKLSLPLMTRFIETFPSVELHNQLGPAERPSSISWRCQPDPALRSVPIGRPLAETRVYLLDRHLELVPPGSVGELYIGGVGLARGYLGARGMTAERFLPDPFVVTIGARMYRTGDLARWRSDGQLDFLGRADFQVKVRGQRIELREIEQCLMRADEVRDAVVVAATVRDEPELVAYVEADGVEPVALRRHAAAELPAYMVPSRYVVMTALPLSTNGKVDRRALPPVHAGEGLARAGSVAPRDTIEERLVEIWRDVLERPEVGVTDDFFELGGYSLLAMQLTWRIQAETGLDVQLADLFGAPTIGALAALLRGRRQGGEAPRLEALARRDVIPAAPVQRGLWLHDQQHASAPYIISHAFRLSGPLDAAAFVDAFVDVVLRHEILRTTFAVADDGLMQRIHEHPLGGLARLELTALAEREVELRARAREVFRAPIDLVAGPPYRGELLTLGAEEHVLLLGVHHIVADGWSMAVLFEDWATAYKARRAGRIPDFTPLEVQYGDYAHWQHRRLESPAGAADRAFWIDALADPPEPVELPGRRDMTRAAGSGRELRRSLPAALVDALRRVGRRCRTSLHAVVVALVRTLLYRYTGQRDLSVGVFSSGRSQPALAGQLGHFVNTMALRGQVRPREGFAAAVIAERDRLARAYAHDSYPFDQVVREVGVPRVAGRTPLLDVFVVFDAREAEPPAIDGVSFEVLEHDECDALDRLVLAFHGRPSGLDCELMFRESDYDAGFIERMWEHLGALAEAACADPDAPLEELDILPASERRFLLAEVFDSRAFSPAESTLLDLIDVQVARAPNAVAVEGAAAGDDCQSLTYAELDARSRQLAAALVARGVALDQPVALVTDRVPDFIVGALGILRAGGAYLPLDAQQPLKRLATVLDIAGVELIVAPESPAPVVLAQGRPVVTLAEAFAEPVGPAPGVRPCADNLAYIIYTSGSTGRPKGVAVTHRNVVELVRSAEFINTGPDRAFLQIVPLTFDGSMLDVWPALTSGARLVMHAPRVPSLTELRRMVASRGITNIFMPTGLMHLAITEAPDFMAAVPQLVTGGDVLSASHVAALAPVMRGTLSNVYAPTECTVIKTAFTVRRGDELGARLPIGRPLPDARIYIVDQDLRLLPVDVPGELCIAGAGLARGYIGAPAATAGRFIPDPLGPPGGRMYRTGDLACYRADGTLDFLGRLDEQVKIRGHRVEPAEIEAALSRYVGVRRAVVLTEGGGAEKGLVAFVAAEPSVTAEDLRAHVAAALPKYMIPSRIIRLDRMPYTANGKVDRAALRGLKRERRRGAETATTPASPLEARILALVSGILDSADIGVCDDLFERGLDSLMAIRLVARMRTELELELPIARVFELARVRELAAAATQVRRRSVARMVLREGRGPTLYVLPSIFGYASVFQAIARHLDDIACEGFELKDEDDPFVDDRLSGLVRDSPCVLMGYSAGGNMAFHLATRLPPDQLAALIIVDASVREQEAHRGPGLEARVHERAEELLDTVAAAVDEVREVLTPKLHAILRYWFGHVERGQVDADIHLIVAEGDRHEPTGERTKRIAEKWRRFTRGRLIVHQGAGTHYAMLEEPHVTHNAAIVQRIVDALRVRSTAVKAASTQPADRLERS